MLSVRLLDRTNLVGAQKAIIKAAEKGVEAATQEAVSWIKDDVIRGQQYVGHQHYPEVTPATKQLKAKHGKQRVLIDTGNFLSSWNGKADGLKGVVTGGGQDYAADLYKRGWRIDKLFFEVHAEEAKKIIRSSIETAI